MARAFLNRNSRVLGVLGQLFILLGLTGQRCGAAWPTESVAQGFLLRSWDQDDGLPNSRVNAVARTRDGYLWVATASGLTRFDGARFTTFNRENTPALRDSRVTCLLVDREGTLWAGTAAGTLVRREGSDFLRVDLRGERATRGRSLNFLTQDSAGDIWLATDRAGLIRLKEGQVEVFGITNGLPSEIISQVLCDAHGRLWAIAGGQLRAFNAGAWQSPTNRMPVAQSVRAIASARDGGLWVATLANHPLGGRGGHVFKLKDAHWESELSPYPWPQDSQRSRVQALLEDGQGGLWCATSGSGVFRHTPGGGWQQVTREAPPAPVEALCLNEDETGVVWIGTRTFGLHQVRPRPVNSLLLPPDAGQNVFLSVCARRDGSVWGGTDGAGVFRWQHGERTQYGVERGLQNLQVGVLLEDRQTNLWAGTFGGLFRLREDRFEPAAGPPALREMTTALVEDHRGNLWAGTRGGLVCNSQNGARVFGSADGLEGAPARALAEDQTGAIWVASSTAGLFRQEGARFRRQSTDPLPLRVNIRALRFDSGGALWLATAGQGLFRLKEGAWRQWTAQEDGLPSDNQLALLDEDDDNLWLSSENGIFGMPKRTLLAYQRGVSRKLAPWRITPAEGLAHKVCSGIGQPSACVSGDGRLWFPNGPAIATFHPAAVPRAVKIRPPLIERVVVDGTPPGTNAAGELAVRSGAVTVEFQYTSPNILAPGQIHYRYQLVGLDRDWMDAGTRRTAYYNHLDPGRYLFKVMAGSPGNAWHETAHPLPFEVMPRTYERLTVQILGGLVFVGAVAAFVWRIERTRSHRRLERLHLQGAMDQERQRIARDIHDDLGSGLTEIILLSDTLRDETAALPGSEHTAAEISTRARSLTRAMDEVVWALNPRNDSLESLLTYLNRFAQEYLTRAGIRCRWDVPVDLPPIPLSAETRHHLYLACKEALNNVVKHAVASEVWVRLQANRSRFTLVIEDNGRGFNGDTPPERGNGLPNMRKRLEELGGACAIESTPGGGTRVEFTVSPTLDGDSQLRESS